MLLVSCERLPQSITRIFGINKVSMKIEQLFQGTNKEFL